MNKNFLQYFAGEVSITGTQASALIPEEVLAEVAEGAVAQSTVLSLGHRLPDMGSATTKLNVLDQLPMAYFVDGENGLQKTTNQAQEGKKIVAEEIAVIVPVSNKVLEDSNIDVWGDVKKQLIGAFAEKIDGAILLGTDKPATWEDGILTQATTAGSVVTATGDVYQDIMGENGAIAKVEESGYFVNGHIGSISLRSKLRGLVDKNGNPIFATSIQQGGAYTLDGATIDFNRNGALGNNTLLISGDFEQLAYAIRKDITFDVFTEGVVSDANGKVIYNLMQNDMSAIRATMRLGWACPNPVNFSAKSKAKRFPFAVLKTAG